MNMRSALLFLAGSVLVSGCSVRATLPAHDRAQPSATGQTTAAELTPEQWHKIVTLHAAMQQKLASDQPRLAAARAELLRLWSAKKPDRGAILGAQKRLLQLVEKNLEVEDDFHLGLRKIMSPVQRAHILGDDMEGVGPAAGAQMGERGDGIGQMTGGALSGGMSGIRSGGGFMGSLAGYLGSLFGEEGEGDDGGEDGEK